MSMVKRVAIVVPRYGADVVGGAETHARLLAEAMVSTLKWDVTVLTTSAKNYMTWSNEYEEGELLLNGVKVKRFRNAFGRSKFFGFYNKLAGVYRRAEIKIPLLKILKPLIEKLWVFLQGPVSPGLLSEIKNDAYEKVIFFCYLYHPTLAGLPSVAQKAVLVPLAHDEWPFYMECVKRMVSAAPILVCNTDAERDFIFNHIPKQPHQIVETGALGIPDPVESGFQENGIREHIQQAISEPYFLYLGRISAGKGVQILLDSFASYKGACRLVMAGHLEDSIVLPKSDKVIYLGFVDENEKNVLLKNCLAVVNPSQYESLSIIALEGMLWQKPLLLNLNCLVFERYAKHVKTVLGFRSKEELTALLNSYSDSSLPQAELVEARQWVLKKFSWPAVLRNFEKF